MLVDRSHTGSIALSTGARHVLVIPRPRAHRLELAALHFHSERSVLLPHPARTEDRAVPLRAVVRAVLWFAAARPGKRLLVVGHADSAGSTAYDLELSRRRADSVERDLVGDACGRRSAEVYAMKKVRPTRSLSQQGDPWQITPPGPIRPK